MQNVGSLPAKLPVKLVVRLTSSSRLCRLFRAANIRCGNSEIAQPFNQRRPLSSSIPRLQAKSYAKPAAKLNHDVTAEEESQYDKAVAQDKGKSIKTPWHRENSDQKPVDRRRQAGAMTKGKLLTTPTRLFKLVLPLTTRDFNSDRKDVEPLALLVHPQQPLSYLERLIQAELPLLQVDKHEKIRDVNFRAQDSSDDRKGKDRRDPGDLEDLEEPENKSQKDMAETSAESARELRGGPGEGGVESYSGLGHESKDDKVSSAELVRWSKSTEIGDFVRDAARGREFAVEIEGAPYDIRVGVPSFSDRTYYLRLRLRKKAKQISTMADLKRECDIEAHKSAQRVAYVGFGAMVGWAGVVAWLTFMTNLGWDTMEPVTYLVGLIGILGGYLWFIVNRREASYSSAMNLTVSRRQSKLYEEKGFNLQKYHDLVDEGNALRKEIKSIANEYDVDWDEMRDAQDEKVVEALKEHREEKEEKKRKRRDDEDDEDDDDEAK